jgi:AcrR family transcriptional regulator
MSAGARRELVLAAATRAFAEQGYAATTTDTVAREAGVSQPYVVRMFGTKLQLFVEVFEHAAERIIEAFERELDSQPFDPEEPDDWTRLGHAYKELVEDRDFLLVMLHGFTSAGVDEIGVAARACMGRIFALLRRTGGSDEQLRVFVAHGMLINVLVAMRAPEHLGEGGPLADLMDCAMQEFRPPAAT